jgi:hypothetical protein
MDTITTLFCAEYQMRSLVEFLLGDGERPGWLDEQSRTWCQARTGATDGSELLL